MSQRVRRLRGAVDVLSEPAASRRKRCMKKKKNEKTRKSALSEREAGHTHAHTQKCGTKNQKVQRPISVGISANLRLI
jgi:hypothetical protein